MKSEMGISSFSGIHSQTCNENKGEKELKGEKSITCCYNWVESTREMRFYVCNRARALDVILKRPSEPR